MKAALAGSNRRRRHPSQGGNPDGLHLYEDISLEQRAQIGLAVALARGTYGLVTDLARGLGTSRKFIYELAAEVGRAVTGPGPTMTPTATGTTTPTPTASATPPPTATGTPPVAMPTLTATPGRRSPVDVVFEAGWNNVSLPFSPTVPYRASDLVRELGQQGLTAVHFARWQDGTWQSYLPSFGPEDFLLEYGRGYFVRVREPGRWRP